MSDVKVHLGCGKREMPGYLHIDLADFPHIDHRHDIATLPMLDDDSVGLIYASHVLEYFDRIEVANVLREWRRVLAAGGTLRLAVPDFSALTEVYRRHGDLDLVIGPLFGRWQIPGTDTVVFHKTVYDFDALQSVLHDAGFAGVRRWDWREVFIGELAGYDDYSQAYVPHMDKEHGQLISLNVEATK
mgnify:CR=1 FL=1